MTLPPKCRTPTLSVITPTYNRAHLLERVFKSLLKQTIKSFEWIIVDDGSTDETQQVVIDWIDGAPFPITYVFQENQGKPSAYNHAVNLACGEFLTCVDSDDWLPVNGVENRIRLMQIYADADDICGITGLAANSDGKLIGYSFPENGIIGSKQHLNSVAPGDKSTTFKTSVLKKFPFPQFPNEKFLPESIIYNRMFQSGYKFASSNEVLTVVDYQDGGLSDSALSLRMKSLNGTLMYYHEMSLIDFPSGLKLKATSNLVRYTLHKLGPSKYLVRFVLFVAAFPVGLFFYVRDKRRLRAKS